MTTCTATCESIMLPDPVTLLDSTTVVQALKLLLQHRVLALPVVNASGSFIGMFGKHRILSLLLPKATMLDEGVPSLGKLLDLAFMTDNLDDVRSRLKTIGNDPVSRYAETDAPRVEAKAPLMKALLLLYRTRNYLPVINEQGKLVGVLSTFDALERIAGNT